MSDFAKGTKWRVLRNRDDALLPDRSRELRAGDIIVSNGETYCLSEVSSKYQIVFYDLLGGGDNYIRCEDVEPYRDDMKQFMDMMVKFGLAYSVKADEDGITNIAVKNPVFQGESWYTFNADGSFREFAVII